MAVLPVQHMRRDRGSRISDIRSGAGAVGSILALSPDPATKGAGLAMSAGSAGAAAIQPQETPAPQPVDTMDAIQRRQNAIQGEDPRQLVADATVALDQVDLPDETKNRMRSIFIRAGRMA